MCLKKEVESKPFVDSRLDMPYVFLNDDYFSDQVPLIASQDRGFLLGDGVFETLKYRDERLFFFKAHFQRLKKSAAFFSLPLPYTEKALMNICLELIQRNHQEKECVAIRITLSRGVGERGLTYSQLMKPTLLVSTASYRLPETPATLFTSNVLRYSKSVLAHHKTLNYLSSIVARQQAIESGFTEALQSNEKNHLVCASAANIFLIHRGKVVTPSMASGIFPGIMRQYVLEVGRKHGIPIDEIEIDVDCVNQSEAAFLTNSLIGFQPIKKIDAHLLCVEDCALMTQLRDLIERLKH